MQPLSCNRDRRHNAGGRRTWPRDRPAHIGAKDKLMSKVQTTEFWVQQALKTKQGRVAHKALKEAFGSRLGPVTIKDTKYYGKVAAFRITLEDGENWAPVFPKIQEILYASGGYIYHYLPNPDTTLIEEQREAFLGVRA